MTPIKFPSIDQFRHVIRNVQWKAQFTGLDGAGEPIMDRLAKLPTLKFRGTEKIHGSNCSARFFPGGGVACQSRERIITPEDDNYGYARYIHNLPPSIQDEFRVPFDDGTEVIYYGEWAGKGIQNKVAVSEVEKFWVIFAVLTIKNGEEKWVDLQSLGGKMDWMELQKYRIFSIFYNKTWEIDINFENPADAINQMNQWTLEVEKESPLGLKLGVSGIGEGIVWKCAEPGYEGSKFWYKNKGTEHSGSKVTKLADVDVEKMKSINEFIEKTVDEERLNQAWNHLQENKLFDYEKSLGIFLKWIFNDVIKEEKDTLEASGLKEKELGGAIAKKAKVWYFEKLKHYDKNTNDK